MASMVESARLVWMRIIEVLYRSETLCTDTYVENAAHI